MDGGAVEESSQPAENNDPPDEEQEAAVVEVDPTGRYSRFAQILGRGAFKTVYKGFDEQEGIEIAWNQVRVSELVSSREERDRLFAEIRVLKQLKHKNIMTFHDSWLDQSTYSVNFITELFTSGTLRQYRKRHKHIDSEVLKSWAWQILCGLVYLHGHTPPIIHRDLKCDNIFINGGEGVVKIGDLGLATLLRARTAPQSVLGTPEFMAPELYDEDYDDRVDVYSFGMCLLELATLEYPYCECRNAAQIYRKVTLGVRPSSLQKVPEPALAEFINLCIQQRETRPRARQLLKHPYFDSIRQERCNAKLQAEALASTGEANPMAADFGDLGSSSTGTSRSSSAGEGELVQHVEHVRQFQPPLLPHQILEEPSPPPSQHSSPPVSQHNSPRGMSPMQPQQQPEQPQQQVLRPESHHGGGMSSRPGSAVTAGLSDTVMSPRSDVLTVTDHGSNNGDAPTTTSAQQQYLGLAVDQAAASAAMAESLVSMAEVLSEGGGSFFSEAPGGTVVDSMVTADRQFKVKGKLQTDQEKLNLRLRIFEPSGPSKTVEFDFDLAADTAMSVASEMVEDLSLSHEDARAIASAIKNEVQTLTGISPPLPDRTTFLRSTPCMSSQLTDPLASLLKLQAHLCVRQAVPHQA
jgi:WNK lysine deficient protein kinase